MKNSNRWEKKIIPKTICYDSIAWNALDEVYIYMKTEMSCWDSEIESKCEEDSGNCVKEWSERNFLSSVNDVGGFEQWK